MAEEVKVSKFAKLRRNLVRFAKEIRNELKKVIWLTRQQLINNTVTVIVMCIIVGGIIWLADWGLLELAKRTIMK